MTIKNGDLPAMPVTNEWYEPCGQADLRKRTETYSGLTKREMFAMAAMQGLIGVYWSTTDGYDSAAELVKCLAESSVEHADALLAELEKAK